MRFKAYLFDVQGTLMDFFGPVSAAVGRYLDGIGADRVDAAEFTRGWRRNYFHRIADNPPQPGNWRRVQEHTRRDSSPPARSTVCPNRTEPSPRPSRAVGSACNRGRTFGPESPGYGNGLPWPPYRMPI